MTQAGLTVIDKNAHDGRRGVIGRQARTRALGRAVENPKVGEMFDDQVLPKTVAAQFGTVSKDADHEQLKAECLERAYAVYTEAKQSMVDKPMAEQGKIISDCQEAGA